jgi:parallel beta-helix repeat protein
MSLKIHAWSGFVLFCLITSAILAISAPHNAINVDSSSDSFRAIVVADTTPHSPINISSNQDFILQGWPGNGTANNPYRIENLSIDTTMSCINVSNTDVFIEVAGCSLSINAPRGIYCLHFNNVTNCAIANCIIATGYYGGGIFFQSCENCSVEQCEIDSTDYCVGLEYCSACVICYSTMSSDLEAVLVHASSNIEIQYNDVDSSYYGWGGIVVGRSTDFRIGNNSVRSASGWSVEIVHSSSGVIANNTIKGGYDGVRLNNVTDCSILTNDVSENSFGLYLELSHDCIITSNLIRDNNYGIMDLGANNTYSKNTFSTNLETNAEDAGEGNVWLQNRWDDYVGFGWYPIPGVAGSFDTNPEPKNTVLLAGTVASIIIILLSSLSVIAVVIRRVRHGALIDSHSTDWDLKMHLTLPLIVTMLLPSGIFLYFPDYSPARWLVLGATLFGAISWTAYPPLGHRALEFIFPLTDEYLIVLYCTLLSLLWFIFSAILVRRFWLFAGGELPRKTVRISVFAILLVIILFSLVTLSVPLPVTPLTILLQMSRIKNPMGN